MFHSIIITFKNNNKINCGVTERVQRLENQSDLNVVVQVKPILSNKSLLLSSLECRRWQL